MEISALTKIASFFPEYKLSNQWIDYSIKEMTKSMQEQIYPDGVQTELSSHYHNVFLKTLSSLMIFAFGMKDYPIIT